MRTVLSQLERILDRLSAPESLEAEEIGFLAQDWDAAVLRLEQIPEEAGFALLPESEKIYLRVRLQRLMQKMPAIEALLITHKSAVAQQLFTESRRFQSLHSRYLAGFDGTSRLQQKA